MRTLLACIVGTLMLSAASTSEGGESSHHALDVVGPWARSSAGMTGAGAAFMTIRNAGEDDRLVDAASDVAERVELHTHIQDGDVMRMRRVEAISVPTGETVLEPGGLHIMLIDLRGALEEGTSFPLTLVFEHAGVSTVDVAVKAPGAMGHGPSDHGGSKHGHHGR